MIALSFGIFLLIFVIIGALSALQSKDSTKDYLLAGRDVAPWLVGLSAVATGNSGYMFIGMIGFTYEYGACAIWMMIGWILGDFIAFSSIHEKLRIATEQKQVLSYAGALSKWDGNNSRKIRILGGIITLIFLGIYAAAQFSAGSKALHVIFGWDYNVGAIIGAIIVAIYCYAGGIRASIWTDAAQSIVMILAMTLLSIVAIQEAGGFGKFTEMLYAVSPEYMKLNPDNLHFGEIAGPIILLIAAMITGYGVAGQPHVMIRIMTLDNASNMNKVRNYYFSFYIMFYILTIFVGLATRILIPESLLTDTELALPILSQMLLPEILIGVILAGIFAATMSTADSQILSCSATITHDLTPENWEHSSRISKISTMFVTFIALLISVYGSKDVFYLVIIAWNSMACAFTPLLSLYVLGFKISERTALSMMLGGIISLILSRYFSPGEVVFDIEIIPGFVAGYLIFLASRIKT